MQENREADVPCPCRPKPVNLARRANRSRQKLHANEPEDLFFYHSVLDDGVNFHDST